jgi:UDP-3-O-[3-hydroxymyristoyl] glucosamine N-acyltransferase
MKRALKSMNMFRNANGYYSIEELINNVGVNNTIVDPFSVLISRSVSLGKGNTIYPSVILHAEDGSGLRIGDGNLFSANTRIETANGALITIGNNNIFSNGIVCVKCNIKNGTMEFGSGCRFDGRINIFGNCTFGNGSQIIGTINVYNCNLVAGGDYTEPNPDNRAGLIKGVGTARGLSVNTGMVINGFGEFDQSNVEPQSNYHKK